MIEKIKMWFKAYGIKRTLLFMIYKVIDELFFFFIQLAFNNGGTRDIIIFESLNDFDLNSGALYNYLISMHKNEKYIMVWLTHNKPLQNLPQNVIAFDIRKPSLRKTYYYVKARFVFCEYYMLKKRNKNQKVIYLTHGGCTLKNVKGYNNVSLDMDYYLSSSLNYDRIMCDNYSIPYPNDKMLHFGYPTNDVLFSDCSDEMAKLTTNRYGRIILWMPTFRVLNTGRVDCKRVSPSGIPLLETENDLKKLNGFLAQNDAILLIKLHPNQHPKTINLRIKYSNVLIIDEDTAKSKEINSYRLMGVADAFISDYSSASYSYLLLNRPMAFILNDYEDYNRGFIVDDYMRFLPGDIVYNYEQLICFLSNVFDKKDEYSDERERVMDYLYDFKDGNSSSRLVNYFSL